MAVTVNGKRKTYLACKQSNLLLSSDINYFMILKAFVVLALSLAGARASNAYIYPFAEVPSTELEGLTQQQITQLIKYNMGLGEHPTEQQSTFEEMIMAYGKGNMLAPTDMNYLILIESEKLFAAQETKQQRITEGFASRLRMLDKNEKGVMELLFGNGEHSLVSRAERLYKDPNLPFIIYQNEDDLNIQFLEWTVTLYLGKNNEVFFYEPKRDKTYRMESNLEQCVDNFFGTTFDFAPKDGKVYKYNTNEMLTITKENHDLFLAFFKDICAMNKFSQIFKKGGTPNFLTIINKSISKLEKVLNDDEINIVYDMMRIAHKKLSKNFKNYFANEELFGMILVEEEKHPKVTTTKEAAKDQRILMETKNRMLDQSTTAVSVSNTMPAGTYQIYIWFGIFFIILLLGIVYSMVTMDIQKDTLLYAKFLTTDARN